MTIANNIAAFRDDKGWSRPELATRMGTSPQQVERLEKGQRSLTIDWIERAARALGVPVGDIITPGAAGSALNIASAPDIQPTRSLHADDPTVELASLDLSYSMGPGTELDSYIEEEPVRFDPGLLRRITRAPYSRLKLGRGVGDSMQPTLFPGDVVMIDTTQTMANMQDRIYAIAVNGAAAIKRLRFEKGGKVTIVSDNPTVEPYQIDADELTIHGRVIWFGREL